MNTKLARQFRRAASSLDNFGNVHGEQCGMVPPHLSTQNVGTPRTRAAGLGHNHRMERKTDIGTRLRELREGRDLNQIDVATAVDMSRSHLSKIEGNQDTPSRAKLAALAAFFGVSMDYLETGSSPRGSEGPDKSIYSDDDIAWARLGRALDRDQRSAVFNFIEQLASIDRSSGGRGNGRKHSRNKR